MVNLLLTFHFIGMNDAYFNSQCLSCEKRVFSETLSPKDHGQVSFDKNVYKYAVLVSFTATPPAITTATKNGLQIYSTSSIKRKGFATKLR